MAKLKLSDAAETMRQIYCDPAAAEVEVSLDIRGVQVYFLKNGTLVIPGTNEFSDWFEFNFDVFGTEGHGFEVAQGDSGAVWHAGFLEHAQTVFSFAKPLKPKFIIGHSLGAASAQIVGSSLRIPTIAFASPRTNRGEKRFSGAGWVLNICRVDDTVCQVPPPLHGLPARGQRALADAERGQPGAGSPHPRIHRLHGAGAQRQAHRTPVAALTPLRPPCDTPPKARNARPPTPRQQAAGIRPAARPLP
ncbi:hypothetical protein PSA7680_02314 [Pseudoruegeria aquimaris]|uniref:Alpha/beta hydrolase family protein n=1 Tax=Pseudoruegeria aquimaris TaxID=393663 RepID=A0A1Y5SRF9_9RHOB|nr:hypothetical protein [Pseudoruegeria aquimaris]SLN45302.1 hypothetical protein PSA7680_02314 [Pseudoruegeria aquimaris]